MSVFALYMICTAGVHSLLLPFSPAGVITGFSAAQGGEAVFYNPANLTATENYGLTFYYNQLYVGMKSISLALSRKFNKIDFGLGISNYDYGEIEWRPEYPSDDSVITYTANDFSLGVTASTQISTSGKLGVTIRYISENIYIYGDDALAFDLAAVYQGERARISFGATNVGYKLTIKNDEVNLPARLSLGIACDLKKTIAYFDGHYLINTGQFECGQAWRFPVYQTLELRAGLNYRDRFFQGFGMKINTGKFTIDYGGAFYPYNLGMINTIGIGFAF